MSLFNSIRFPVWWNHVILPLTFWVYLVGFNQGLSFSAITFCLLFMVGSACLAAYGYIVNDFFDRVPDKLAGKSNFFDGSPIRTVVIAVSVISVGATAWSFLPLTPITIGLLLLELVLLLTYSAPPLRLKNRTVGILADALYSRVVPVLTVLSFGDVLPVSWLMVVSVWMLIAGIRNILLHQISDVENDALANEQTAVLKIGKQRTKRLILRFLLPLEFLLSIVSMVILSSYTSYIYLTLPFFLVLTLIRFKVWRLEYQSLELWKERALFLPNNFYEDILPLGLLVVLSITNPSFWPLVGAHLLIFPYSSRKTFRNLASIASEMANYFLVSTKSTFEYLYHDVRPQLKKAISIVVNKPIIWIFLFAGVNLEEENLSAWGYIKKSFNRL